nr:unnamed protein product [Haemonchus contortus]
MADNAALLERCFDDLLLESDAEDLYELEEEEGLVAAVVRDLEDFDTDDTDEGDSDSDTEDNIWTDDACCDDRWVVNEPTGAHQDVEYCGTPLDSYELFFPEELLEMVAMQTNIYGHQKSQSWKEILRIQKIFLYLLAIVVVFLRQSEELFITEPQKFSEKWTVHSR